MTVCLMQQIWNSGVYWRLPTSRRRSLGWKLWLISFLSTVLLTKSPPWQTSMQVFLGPLSVGAGKAESASYSNYRRPLQWFNCFYSQRQPPYFHYGTVSFQGCKGSHLWCPCIFHCLLFGGGHTLMSRMFKPSMHEWNQTDITHAQERVGTHKKYLTLQVLIDLRLILDTMTSKGNTSPRHLPPQKKPEGKRNAAKSREEGNLFPEVPIYFSIRCAL